MIALAINTTQAKGANTLVMYHPSTSAIAPKIDMAITHLRKALQINPDYVLARQNLEKALETQKQEIEQRN